MELAKLLTILSLSLLLLSSCGLFKRKVVTEYVYVMATITEPTPPRPLSLSKIDFDVVSYKNLETFLSENEKRNGAIVFIAMDVREYENLSLNTAEMRRYIEQQMGIIEYYQSNIREAKRKQLEADALSKAK